MFYSGERVGINNNFTKRIEKGEMKRRAAIKSQRGSELPGLTSECHLYRTPTDLSLSKCRRDHEHQPGKLNFSDTLYFFGASLKGLR